MSEHKSASFRTPKSHWFARDDIGRSVPWEISICGDLTDRQAEMIESLTEVPRQSRGILYFDSCGGSVYTGLALGTLIRLRGLRVTGVVLGECSSAALLPFAACDRRFVTPHSTLLFHPMRWQSEEDVRLEEATEWARHFKDLESRLDILLSQLLNVELSALATWTRPGRFVSGPELAERGIAELFDPFQESKPWQKLLTSLSESKPAALSSRLS
jgi:ATP-dependent Clp protease protease subunit